ncbi:MFS transporter [Micromonospora peucetia]|uniref:MFS transporter n=1 Tax=Micromonospora peucetia TaxID=47871 RepID=A0A1C6VXL8_9ACTN|nr:MFS transporter [Micromonospora peucetia]WSA31379.1 MFS transporter [Micromonospora peucetia]SCL70640.1 Major Facilitator Superfamily protein [Micromonospora peucetia]
MDGHRFAVSRLLPPPGLPRAIAYQSAMVAVGSGTFLTGSIVFFTEVLGLSPVQIGVGFSVAGLAGVVTSLPLGALADRIGGQRSWALGALGSALTFAAYPLVTSFAGFVVLMVVAAVTDSFANAGRTIYTADAMPAGDRVRTMAYARSYLNAGFTVGTGLGAVALAFGSTAALVAMVLLNAALSLLNAGLVTRLPAAPAMRHDRAATVSRWAVLKDLPYVTTAALLAVMMFHSVILVEILPLWAITHTDAPKPLLGAMLALNTVLVITLQVPAARGADSLPGAARLIRRGALVTAVACPLAALAGWTGGGWTVVVLLGVVVLVTTTELWFSAALWFVQTNVPPAGSRGVYLGTAQTISSAADVFAPVGLTLLAIQTGGWGWWVVAALFVGCALAAGPAVGWVARTPRIAGAAADPPATSTSDSKPVVRPTSA